MHPSAELGQNDLGIPQLKRTKPPRSVELGQTRLSSPRLQKRSVSTTPSALETYGTRSVAPVMHPIPVTESVAAKDWPEWQFNDVSPEERRQDVNSWLHSVILAKNENYSVPPCIDSVLMGLGWNRCVDVDASVALFDRNYRSVDTVWYKKLKSTCGSVLHSGDNRTGAGDGDDEVISVNLDEIPLHVHYLLFTVSIYSYGVSFKDIESAYVRMMHGKQKYKSSEMCYFSLKDMSGCSMLMGLLIRKGACWDFKALGSPATGRSIKELLQNPHNLSCLSESPSYSPELRRVTVAVTKGVDLAAKDRSGIFRKVATSDPYFVIRFGKKTITSEYKPKTVNPEWKCPDFDLGVVTESDRRVLEIEVFDYDAIGSDDFMGLIRVPGHSLFSLNPGGNVFWCRLSDSKKYKDKDVSGKILVSINVEVMNTEPRLI